MADQQTEITQVARAEADKVLDAAIGALRAAARKIGQEHGIPEGIGGHSIDELLGRMAYIPSMARDLRRVAGQELAKLKISAMMAGPAAGRPARAPQPAPKPIEPSKIPDVVPVGMDLVDLDGVTVQAVKALKAAGLKTVGDIVVVPDEHLLKIDGIAEKSLAQIRAAIAKASVPKKAP